jgi:predicted TPR repeat methyltransferase
MADAVLQEAKRLHQAGRLADAVALYQRIVQADPAQFEALYGLGMAHAQQGRLAEGQRALEQALKINPRFAEGWRARGLMLMHLGRHEAARTCVERALELKPDFKEAQSIREALAPKSLEPHVALARLDAELVRSSDSARAWNDRGSVLAGMGRREDALASFDQALSLKPDFIEALSNRATVLFEMDRLKDALAAFDAVLAIRPDLAIAWNNRGNTLTKMGRFDEAVASYDRALELRPDFAEAKENRELPLFELGETVRSPAKYMRGLFDGFSHHYDDTMLNKLDYRAHLHVRAMVERVAPQLKPPPWRILDLGCGTGLVGVALKGLAPGSRLDGIDLSPRMLEAARARGFYSDLILGDLETVLAQSGPSYDLIVSADTMTYFGNLAPVFSGVARRLEPGGVYVFASEAKAGDGWEKTKVHRYRHGKSYLHAEAERVGLAVIDLVRCTLRYEESQPVSGFTVALRSVTRP